ncbi:MAG: DUF177 domain-containing protein [Clostridia bacterium]
MRINLKQIKNDALKSVPFDYFFSIADVEPKAKEPLHVSGSVYNRADVVQLTMNIEADLDLTCDRCAKDFKRNKCVLLEAAVVSQIEGEETEGIIVCENDELDLDELAGTTFILEMDSKDLCREDCAGLCPMCGADLNTSSCNCSADEIDPRLLKLRELLLNK